MLADCTPTFRPRSMSGESYTRWRSSASDDEDDDALEEGESGAGRSRPGAVTVITARTRPPTALSPAAQARMVCVMVLMMLVCLVCVGVGVCVGLAWGYSQGSRHSVEHVIPAPAPDYQHAHRVLSYLQPHLLHDYMRKLSETPKPLLGTFVESVWETLGLRVNTTTFLVHLSRPDEERPNTVEVTYVDGHKYVLNPLPHTVNSPPFSAFSPAGEVTGPLVYGHYGRREDLATLQSLKISVKGAVVLLRDGKIHNGAKVHNAEQAGAGGVLLYPDPADMRGPRGGGAPYPNGTGLPDDGVIWDTLSIFPGDPATPFLPSIDHIYRSGRSSQPIPKIPVQSVSAEVAQTLLELVGGPEMPEGWRGGLDTVYRLGGTWRPEANVTNLTLAVNNVMQQETVKNIHATLPAVDESKVVMVGSHYGSLYTSPGAGLGALLALSDAFAKSYLTDGTQRQVVFSAWAASEHGLIGSTEFTQKYSWWVDTTMLAYLNMDEMLRGTGCLRVMASPVLRQAIREAATQVMWPMGEAVNVRDGWRMSDPLLRTDVHFSNLGSESDFASFTAQRGVPSAHFVVTGEQWVSSNSLRHSQYDTYQAYTSLLDPDYSWTTMLTSLVGAVTTVLSESDLPPLRMSDLSGDLYNGWQHFLDLHTTALTNSGYNFTSILDAIQMELITLDTMLSGLDRWYHSRPYYVHPYPHPFPGPAHYRQVEQRLRWLANLERGLLGPRGVGRASTTNLMIGPDPEDPYRAIHYPHAVQAITHALLQKTPWESVHQELSYILAALTSYRQLFPITFPDEPHNTTDGDFAEPQS
nr:aminopeptidase NAALADL1-like [Procambarus clarkii]